MALPAKQQGASATAETTGSEVAASSTVAMRITAPGASCKPVCCKPPAKAIEPIGSCCMAPMGCIATRLGCPIMPAIWPAAIWHVDICIGCIAPPGCPLTIT